VKDWTWEFKNEFKLVEPARTALVIINMQNATACRTEGIAAVMRESGEHTVGERYFSQIEQVVLPNLKKLLTFFRKYGLMVLHVSSALSRQNYSEMATELRNSAMYIGNRVEPKVNQFLPEVAPKKGEPVIQKSSFSAFISSPIDRVLRELNVNYLIFTGVFTNLDVEGTARNAADLSYRCTIAEDCCSSISNNLHNWALKNFNALHGMVRNSNSVINELFLSNRNKSDI